MTAWVVAPSPKADAEAVLRSNSRSFALAARLLAPRDRSDLSILYAWCRRADDAIDLAGAVPPSECLLELRRELTLLSDRRDLSSPLLSEFRGVLERRRIPLDYPLELLDGLEMDVCGHRYRSFDELLVYCWRVAGVVGVMLCHIFGVSHPSARRQAAHLGIAMQLTNICRDVLEDWDRGRLYLPEDLLNSVGAPNLTKRVGQPLPRSAREALALAVEQLLNLADRFYRSADSGMHYLPFRAGWAARVARLVYSEIGSEIRRRGSDVFAGRCVVPAGRKVVLVVRALLQSLASWPRIRGARSAQLRGVVEFGRNGVS